ncbi:MAG: bifunctional phosphopantothenoylcysteine decarboxylase/phosphopantothenate--cysteine ligase CoaBC [Neomegalonema sp.]|nr:bifunctional phosphopantothenoylcysteine decarboxylase/phosphopantothenate--cysteine ligase CoaBC [Neomegalonema sp.]
MTGKRVLLIIGGGIAAYKSLELVRELTKRGHAVRCVMTKAAQEFVTPLSFASLSGEKVHTELFAMTDEVEMGHIELSRSADLVVVAPATADLMAKMAQGLCNDLASTLLLATDKPVMIAPAMNVRMWEHPATQRNLITLRHDGVSVIGPDEGSMACGEFGPGRMAEPVAIADAIEAHFAQRSGPLAGKRVLVTSGPTHEPIDPVRYIANRSSGKQGSAIAQALARAGADVQFVTGPAEAPKPEGCAIIPVETAAQMHAAALAALPCDIAIFAAAVADWRVQNAAPGKVKKDGSGKPPSLKLTENPDILREISQLKPGKRPALVIGFAAETDEVLANATAKRMRKGCDWLVANDVSPATGIMGGDQNEVHLLGAGDPEHWPRASKAQIAERLVARIIDWAKSSNEKAVC